MKVLIVFALCIAASVGDGPMPQGTFVWDYLKPVSHTPEISEPDHAIQYVWDFLKPALAAGEVQTLIATRGEEYPRLVSIPGTSFQCSSMHQPGYYADLETKCQVFHRCDQAGNMTSYICVNSTVFNQITLVCDAWFNVECERSGEFVNFANSRLYTNLPLFDTPPADYIPPRVAAKQAAASNVIPAAFIQSVPKIKPVAGKKTAVKNP